MAKEKLITDITSENFTREVLDVSRTMPVLVDFWADWCQPCKQLSPLLEAVAKEQAGKLKVVKINTDVEQQLAMQFGIRSLPTVAVIKAGRLVDQFTGLIPKPAIDQFLERHLLRESDLLRQQALVKLASGDQAGAIAMLRSALAADPENYRLHPDLARLLAAAGDIGQAEAVLSNLPANEQLADAVVSLRASLKFQVIAQETPDVAQLRKLVAEDRNNLKALFQLSAHQVIAGDYEPALEQLLDIVRRDRKFGDDAARKAVLDIFTLLGNSGELVKRYRSRLAGMLN